jgi:hypothetical protein
MADKPMKIPGPDHPISIDANPSRVVVTVGGQVIADTRDALTLREASYPAARNSLSRATGTSASRSDVATKYAGVLTRATPARSSPGWFPSTPIVVGTRLIASHPIAPNARHSRLARSRCELRLGS